MTNYSLKSVISRKIEAHKLSRRLKQVRRITRAPSPWLQGFAQAIKAGLSEDEALEDLSNKHEEQKNS